MRTVIDRPALKSKAKTVLKKYYWLLFVVSLVAILIGGTGNNGSSVRSSSGNINVARTAGASHTTVFDRILPNVTSLRWDSLLSVNNTGRFVRNIIAMGVAAVVAMVGLMALFFRIFISFPVRTGCNRIFIDTAGRSPYNKEHMEEIRQCTMLMRPDEVILVLSATTSSADIVGICKEFNVIGIDKIIFTKLDETKAWGQILNAVHEVKKPIAYFTNGQNVPDDIIVPDPGQIAARLLMKKMRNERPS